MICPTCNVQMNHLNKGGGHSWTDSYETYDYVQCPKCEVIAIEFYHTELITGDELLFPVFNLISNNDLEWKT